MFVTQVQLLFVIHFFACRPEISCVVGTLLKVTQCIHKQHPYERITGWSSSSMNVSSLSII